MKKTEIFERLQTAPAQDLLLIMVHPWYPLLPPLGLAYVSTYIRSKGYNVLLFDFNAKLYNNSDSERKKFWDVSTISQIPYFQLIEIFKEKFSEEIETLISLLVQRPEPIIGFSTNYLNVRVASYISRKVKQHSPHKLIVFGGPGCFWGYDRNNVIPGSVDFFVIGEGEKPFFELVDNFYHNRPLTGIAGIVTQEEKEQVRPNPVTNLDEIPFPDFKEFDLDDYGCGEAKALPLLTSRGCISRCSFCVDYMMCNPFRMRSPEHVIAEIEHHINEYNIRNFSFNDLLCNGDLKKLERMCELIIDKKLNIQWGSYAIARGDMSLQLLRKMKEAGCTTICYGIESGSNKVLKMMRKIYTAEDAQRTLRLTHQAGIRATFNIIIGYPQEGRREFKETLAFVRRNKDYIHSIINVSTLFINPTASLGKEPQKYGLYFPRSPWAFKFISLKKILPKYYKIFGQSTPVEKLPSVDISEFVDNRGNTKSVRIKRLVKTLKFLNKLGLFKEDPIINVYITKSKKVSRTIEKIQKRWTIENNDLCLRCDYKGLAQLKYKGNLITQKAGFTSALLINDNWHDSSHYEWNIRKLTSRKIKITIYMKNLNITQLWWITLGKDCLRWKWKIWAHEDTNIKTMKLGILLPEVYKYWRAGKTGGELPSLDNVWKVVELNNSSSVILISETGTHPVLEFGIKSRDRKMPLRLESAIKDYGFRFVNFCFYNCFLYKEKQLQGRIDISVSPGSRDLSTSFREKDREIIKFYDENFSDGVSLPSILENNVMRIEVDKGMRIFYRCKEVTENFGGNVSFLYKDRLFDITRETTFYTPKACRNLVTVEFSWNNLPLSLKWRIYLKNNLFLWSWIISTKEHITLQNFKAGLLLNSVYTFWATRISRGRFPPQDREWIYIPVLESENRRMWLSVFPYTSEYPAIDIQKSPGGKFQCEVPAAENLSGVFVHNLIPYLHLTPQHRLRGNLIVKFGSKNSSLYRREKF